MVITIPLSPQQSARLTALAKAKTLAQQLEASGLSAVALGTLTDAQLARCTNLNVTADALVCTLPDATDGEAPDAG